MIKVGINALPLERRLSGVGIYTKQLIDGLINTHVDLELYSYGKLDKYNYYNLLKSSNRLIHESLLKKFLWSQWDIYKLISNDTKIFHSTSFILPLNKKKGVKYIITVHDFAFKKFPELYDKKTLLYLSYMIKNSLKKADKIICVSNSCKNDLIEFYPFTEDKAVVVYNGYTNMMKAKKSLNVFDKLKIVKQEYFITVGNMHPRKNLLTMIEVFNRVNETYPALKFIIIGNNDDVINNDYQKMIKNKNIKFTGYIEEDEIATLYQEAKLCLFMSVYEGFGFPVLESMCCGVPVITCNNSSLPEVSGYSEELLLNHTDVGKAVDIIFKLMKDKEYYNELSKSSRKQSELFSWQKMTEETIKVYNEIIL